MSHNMNFVRSDASGTEVIASTAITTAFSGTIQVGSTDCRDFENVTHWVECTAKSTATRIDVQVSFSEDDVEFDPQKTESVSGANITATDAVFQFDIQSRTAPFVLGLSLPTHGRRHAQVAIRADQGTPTCSVKAQRGA